MPNVRGIARRLKAVRNIGTITKAMELAAAARLRRAANRLAAARPGAAALEAILGPALGAAGAGHPLLTPGTGDTCGLVVLTSDRGLCGGHNKQVLAAARQAAEQIVRQGLKVRCQVIGKKGAALVRHPSSLTASAAALPAPCKTAPAFHEAELYQRVRALADELVGQFRDEHLVSVDVAYMAAPSHGVSRAAVLRLLPLAGVPAQAGAEAQAAYDLLPDVGSVLEELLPLAVRLRLFQCFLASAVSEHTSRLLAMRAATTNADEMARSLTRQLNRTRQGRITAELAEIMGGAEALK